MTFVLAISVSLVPVSSSPSPFFHSAWLFCVLSRIIFFPQPVLSSDTCSSMHGPGNLSAPFPTCLLPIPAPDLCPLPLPLPLLLLPPRKTFQCVLFTIPLFTVIFFGCVILSVLRKALGCKVETAFSSSFLLLQSGVPKACSERSSWTAPWWQWAWLPKPTK